MVELFGEEEAKNIPISEAFKAILGQLLKPAKTVPDLPIAEIAASTSSYLEEEGLLTESLRKALEERKSKGVPLPPVPPSTSSASDPDVYEVPNSSVLPLPSPIPGIP